MKLFVHLLLLTFFGAALAQTERRIRKVFGIPSNRLIIQEDAVQILLALKYNLPSLQKLPLSLLLSKVQRYSRHLLQGAQKPKFLGFGIGQKLYFQKCLFSLKRWTRVVNKECDIGNKFINKNKILLNSKSDDLFGKAKVLREASISKITKFASEKQAAAADKKNSEEILQCITSTKKYYIERIEATGPKLEDDFKQMQKFAFDDMDILTKSVADIKSGIKKKYLDSEQELKRCKGVKCLLETSERLGHEYKTLRAKIQITAKGAESILKNFFYKSGNLYPPYMSNVNGLQKDSESALSKCLTGKYTIKK